MVLYLKFIRCHCEEVRRSNPPVEIAALLQSLAMTKDFMTNETKILGGIGIVTIIIVIAAAFMFGGKANPDKQALSASQQKVLITKDSHRMTAPGAKVTLVEFGDFQ